MALSGIQHLLLLLFVVQATWSLPFPDVVRNNSSDYNKTYPDKLPVKVSPSNPAEVKIRHRRYYDNEYDEPLHKVCRSGCGFYGATSSHSNWREDRVWRWHCRRVLSSSSDSEQCSWSLNVNNYDSVLYFECGSNRYLKGVQSYHDDWHEDRVWSFYCCSSPRYVTSSCYYTSYLNGWDGPLDYQAGSGKFLVGAYSYHNSYKEDRRWKFKVCTLSS